MNEEFISTVAKRTFKEILRQIKSTPNVVIPFAILGLLLGNVYVTVIGIALIIALVAYDEYKKLINEIETDVKAASFAAEAERTEPVEPLLKEEDQYGEDTQATEVLKAGEGK